MSLNWNLNKIKNVDTLCWITADYDAPGSFVKGDTIMHPVTHALIWSTVRVGIGEITEKNIDLWLERLACLDAIGGTLMIATSRTMEETGKEENRTKDRPFTRAELEAHIGLTTNVSFETKAEFTKKVIRAAQEKGTHIREDFEREQASARMITTIGE